MIRLPPGVGMVGIPVLFLIYIRLMSRRIENDAERRIREITKPLL